MARAFFYAGARALLVSHWEVASDAAVKLTTRTLAKLKVHPEIGRAEAMMISMRELIETGDLAQAHPSYWAPFVVVGEGSSVPNAHQPKPKSQPIEKESPVGWKTEIWRR